MKDALGAFSGSGEGAMKSDCCKVLRDNAAESPIKARCRCFFLQTPDHVTAYTFLPRQFDKPYTEHGCVVFEAVR